VHEGLDLEVLNDYLNKLKQYRKETGQVIENFIIFDDLQGVLNTQDNTLNSLFSTFRHYGSSIFLSCQYMNQAASTTLRENTQYAICFNSKTENTIKSLFQSFGQLFDNYNEFKKHFLNATKESYHAMLYIESEEDKAKNYQSIIAANPEQMKGIKINF
jgi:NhaP-type Na+/H+ and K+/H+ antiporter